MSEAPPSRKNPIGNPSFPGRTFTNGPNWLGWLLDAAPENTLAYNFAVGGTMINGSDQSFPVQAANFSLIDGVSSDFHAALTRNDECVIIIWFGTNDVLSTLHTGAPDYGILNAKIKQGFKTVNHLRSLGAARFIFLGIPRKSEKIFWNHSNLTSCTALWQMPHYHSRARLKYLPLLMKACAKWNADLLVQISAFKHDHPECNETTFLDPQPAFDVVLQHPEAYGAPDSSCTRHAQNCLWADTFHPAQALSRSISQTVEKHLRLTGFF